MVHGPLRISFKDLFLSIFDEDKLLFLFVRIRLTVHIVNFFKASSNVDLLLNYGSNSSSKGHVACLQMRDACCAVAKILYVVVVQYSTSVTIHVQVHFNSQFPVFLHIDDFSIHIPKKMKFIYLFIKIGSQLATFQPIFFRSLQAKDVFPGAR